jgi:hypothetical protein
MSQEQTKRRLARVFKGLDVSRLADTEPAIRRTTRHCIGCSKVLQIPVTSATYTCECGALTILRGEL